MKCKTPVCSQVLQYSCVQGNQPGNWGGGCSLARELVSHPCTTLPLGRTVWGVQGEQGATFLACCAVQN